MRGARIVIDTAIVATGLIEDDSINCYPNNVKSTNQNANTNVGL